MTSTQPQFKTLHPFGETDGGYGKILAVLWRRRLWVAGLMAATLGVATVQTLRQPPTYMSSMDLLVEPNYKGKGETSTEEEKFADANVQIDMSTQISLMQSSGLLRKAMALLQADYPDEFDPKSPGSVNAFKSGVSIVPVSPTIGGKKNNAAASSDTKIFQISYSGSDRVQTQKVLKALQKVYLDYNLEQQKERLNRGLAFINDQLPKVADQVKQSESALEEFRSGQQLIDPEAEARSKVASLDQFQQQQKANLAQIRELQTRYASLQQQVSMSPQQAVLASRLTQSPRYQNLLSELQRTDLALVQQRLRFKDNTPFVATVLDQRQKQMGLLREEVDRVLGGRSGSSEESLMAEGQLGSLDLTLINQLVEAQINLQSAVSRYQSLARTEDEIRQSLKQFPKLLAEYGRLQPEIELNRDTLKQLLKARQDLGMEIARGGFAWQIVEEPQLGYQTGPDYKRNLMLAAVVGLLLGGAAAFARESADDAVHNSDDLKNQTSVPLLGIIPEVLGEGRLSSGRQGLAPTMEQVLHYRPLRESLDLLYQNIQLLSGSDPLKSLVITSALAGEGKSMLVLGLAISAARLHQRVLLIDADLRRPTLHQLLDLPNDRGLSTLLTSDAPIPQQVGSRQANLRSNISVLTAGPTPTDPAKLLSSPRMKEILATFEQNYDLVLLDATPVLGMVDAILASSCCKGVIMVGRMGQVTRTQLTQATTALSKLNVIGVVANGATDVVTSNINY